MAISAERLGIAAILAFAAAIALYYATSQTKDTLIDPPEVQTEVQFAGLDAAAGISYGNPGGPLDMSSMFDLHFWRPGWVNSGSKLDNHPVIYTQHRYPVVPGGNVSTVMHKGWSALMQLQPKANGWFLNPPEAAVL